MISRWRHFYLYKRWLLPAKNIFHQSQALLTIYLMNGIFKLNKTGIFILFFNFAIYKKTAKKIIILITIITFKETVSLGNKLFLNSTHLLDINFCANNNYSKVFIY